MHLKLLKCSDTQLFTLAESACSHSDSVQFLSVHHSLYTLRLFLQSDIPIGHNRILRVSKSTLFLVMSRVYLVSLFPPVNPACSKSGYFVTQGIKSAEITRFLGQKHARRAACCIDVQTPVIGKRLYGPTDTVGFLSSEIHPTTKLVTTGVFFRLFKVSYFQKTEVRVDMTKSMWQTKGGGRRFQWLPGADAQFWSGGPDRKNKGLQLTISFPI